MSPKYWSYHIQEINLEARKGRNLLLVYIVLIFLSASVEFMYHTVKEKNIHADMVKSLLLLTEELR